MILNLGALKLKVPCYGAEKKRQKAASNKYIWVKYYNHNLLNTS